MKIDSLETKPSSGGIPAMAPAPSTVTAKEKGRARARAGMRRRSRVPVVWSTTPTIMNSPDLNIAWAMVWIRAAAMPASVPVPIAATIRPSWLTVE